MAYGRRRHGQSGSTGRGSRQRVRTVSVRRHHAGRQDRVVSLLQTGRSTQ